jgi:hypothetical protein
MATLGFLVLCLAVLDTTQQSALVQLGLCSVNSTFTCTLDFCNPGLTCYNTTINDVVRFGSFTNATWSPLVVPTEIALFPALEWV